MIAPNSIDDRQIRGEVATEAHDAPAEQGVRAIESLFTDLDHYLSSWLQRLGREITAGETGVLSAKSLQERRDEFLREKQSWEIKREHEARQIEEQVRQLTEAWLRLENEQREFLQMKETHCLGSQERPPARGASEVPRDAGPIAQRPAVVCQTESAVRQFNQLKREIASTRPSPGSR